MTAGLRLAAGLAALLLAGCGGEPDDPQPEAAPSTTHSVSSAPASSPVPTTRESIPPSLPQPYIAQVVWAQTEVGPSLQVYPTQAGREVSGDDVEQLAWDEVLVLEPAADTPGMKEQFACHWRFARLVDPDKTSWNLEPERPVVDEQEMIAARCNPGFAEEQ